MWMVVCALRLLRCSCAIREGVQPTDRSARHLCPQRLLLHADGSMCPAVRCGCSYAICEGVQTTDRSARHPCPQRVLLHVDGAICQ